MIKIYVEVILRQTIKMLVSVFKIFPIKENVILIDSMFGKSYSDNAKYIAEYLNVHYSGKYTMIWGFINPSEHGHISGVKAIKYRSLTWFYYHMVSKVVIYSHHIYNFLPYRKKQISIMTWHAGGAYKRIGTAVLSNTEKESKLHELRNKHINKIVTYFVSSSYIFTKYNIEEVYDYKGNVLNIGLPRNDLFFDESKCASIVKKVKKHFGIKGYTVLYAPTFRSKIGGDIEKIDINVDFTKIIELLEEKKKQPVSILFRSHYYDEFSYESTKVINVTNYPDMQELLCTADMLITDYSSCMWDFALTGKPCMLYVPDLRNYRDREQGFFTAIETWPGVVCESMEELCEKIIDGNAQRFNEISTIHLNYAQSYESGNACRKLADIINKEMEGSK